MTKIAEYEQWVVQDGAAKILDTMEEKETNDLLDLVQEEIKEESDEESSSYDDESDEDDGDDQSEENFEEDDEEQVERRGTIIDNGTQQDF